MKNKIFERYHSQRTLRAFTLIEMLVVITVIALLMAIAAPSFFGSIGASRLTQAGDQLLGELSMAQQSAIATGRPVEVRFYKSIDPNDPASATERFRSYLILDYYQPGQNDPRAVLGGPILPPLEVPLALARTPLKLVGNGVLMSDIAALSPLLTATVPTSPIDKSDVLTFVSTPGGFQPYELPEGDEYVAFIFYPESTSLNTGSNYKWFVTMVDSAEITKAPADLKNFYTIQIDPANGRLTNYRP